VKIYPEKKTGEFPGLKSWKRYAAILLVAGASYIWFFKVVFF
jgi:hypothetical protein